MSDPFGGWDGFLEWLNYNGGGGGSSSVDGDSGYLEQGTGEASGAGIEFIRRIGEVESRIPEGALVQFRMTWPWGDAPQVLVDALRNELLERGVTPWPTGEFVTVQGNTLTVYAQKGVAPLVATALGIGVVIALILGATAALVLALSVFRVTWVAPQAGIETLQDLVKAVSENAPYVFWGAVVISSAIAIAAIRRG